MLRSRDPHRLCYSTLAGQGYNPTTLAVLSINTDTPVSILQPSIRPLPVRVHIAPVRLEAPESTILESFQSFRPCYRGVVGFPLCSGFLEQRKDRGFPPYPLIVGFISWWTGYGPAQTRPEWWPPLQRLSPKSQRCWPGWFRGFRRCSSQVTWPRTGISDLPRPYGPDPPDPPESSLGKSSGHYGQP